MKKEEEEVIIFFNQLKEGDKMISIRKRALKETEIISQIVFTMMRQDFR